MSQVKRRLAAIMFTDFVGYTALAQRNESLSLALVEEHRKLVRPILKRHVGREIKTIGDALLVEFESALDAVRCAFDVQRAIREFNISLPEERRIHLRVGVHLGDVIESKGDISGDAVNVASRIESLAEDGGVCLTRQVYDQVQNKFELPLLSLGNRQLKNVSMPLEVFKIAMPWNEETTIAPNELDRKRIAILPFANMSPDPNDSFFADGITEEIISTVSGISGLSVISRTSVMGYKGATKKVREIGKELEVGTVLEGSFRKAGNKIRITAQLVDVATDRHLWVQSYDRELDDAFRIQSDIARQVADSLRVEILPHEDVRIKKEPTRSSEAHSLYLKGRYYWNQRSKESLLKAIEQYQAAIEIDSDYSLAYSGIADCYNILGDHFYMPYAEAFSKLKEYAIKSVELDETSAEGHTSLAWARYVTARDIAASEREFERAIELSPSYATAHHWYAIFLYYTGRREPALTEALRAQKLDPLSPMIATDLGVAYDNLESYGQAEGQYSRALALQPNFLPAMQQRALTYMRQGRYVEAEAEIHAQQIVSKDALATKLELAVVYALAGREEEAGRAMAEADKMPNPGHLHDLVRIAYYTAIGELAKAVELVEAEDQRYADWLGRIAFDPLFSQIRTDPRVKSILKKVGAIR